MEVRDVVDDDDEDDDIIIIEVENEIAEMIEVGECVILQPEVYDEVDEVAIDLDD